MRTNQAETSLVVSSGVLWLIMVGLAATGHWYAALFVLIGLLLIYTVLGSSKEGRPDWKLVIFPSLVWLLMWSGAFWLGDYYARAFAGGPPEFTVLGFHPSFAAIIILFWIVPTLLMGFGFEAVKDRWLSEERWDEFVRKIHESRETDEEQS